MAHKYTNSKGQKYYLYQKDITLRGSDKIQRIYFFKKVEERGALNETPLNYEVMEVKRTGLLVLKKKR